MILQIRTIKFEERQTLGRHPLHRRFCPVLPLLQREENGLVDGAVSGAAVQWYMSFNKILVNLFLYRSCHHPIKLVHSATNGEESFMKKNVVLFFFLSLCVAAFLVSPGGCGAVTIQQVRHWTSPEYTRVVIDISSEVKFDTEEKDRRYSLDLETTTFPGTIPHQYDINQPAVSKIFLIPLPGGKVRVTLYTGKGVRVTVFSLGRILDKPNRIVIDVHMPDVVEQVTEVRKKVREERVTRPVERVVVIDPGHGGEDPGAVGRRYGTYEKDVVLSISRYLKSYLRRRGYKAFLTRTGDYYVSFKKRMQIAREYGADLFISVHADAFRLSCARGSSVYCLSTRSASSEAARILADSQNLSDIIGGVSNGNGEETSMPVTLNMIQTESINGAKAFGNLVLNTMGKVNRLKYSSIHGAPFRVLKMPEIASILVEVAFLSNPTEERRLRSVAWRRKMARAMADAVSTYLPLPEAVLAERSKLPESKPATCVVAKGDCLSDIARRHGTTIAEIMRLNNLKSRNRIYAGQELVLFRDDVPTEYTVRKGDTLEKIALRYGTTVRTLVHLNHLRSRHRIYPGQTLVLTEDEQSGHDYVVTRGDTLSEIAAREGITVAELAAANNITTKKRIYVGQHLRISDGDVAPPEPVVRTPEKTMTEETSSRTHTVKKGDNLDRISRRYHVSVIDLCRLNNMTTRDYIHPGQVLEIPPASIYVVKRGDNLEGIAHRYRTSVTELMALNKLRSRNRIFIGQHLRLPNGAIR